MYAENIRDPAFVSPQLGHDICQEVRDLVTKCDKSRENWEAGDTKPGNRCLRQFSHRHGTEWRIEGDGFACSSCFSSGRICVGFIKKAGEGRGASLRLLPRYKKANNGVVVTDRAYWAR